MVVLCIQMQKVFLSNPLAEVTFTHFKAGFLIHNSCGGCHAADGCTTV